MPLRNYYEGTVKKDGVIYHLVDTNKLTGLFEELGRQVEFGKKTALTKAYFAKPGEEIVTRHDSGEETHYKAQGGEVVFDNGGGDKFVPRDEEGKSNGAQLLKDKYELQRGSLESGDAEYMPLSIPSKLLIGINPDPIRIMNPWGAGSTQDIPAGSTLKLDGNKVTGIEKTAFEKTWSRTDEKGNILKSATQRADGKTWKDFLDDTTSRKKC